MTQTQTSRSAEGVSKPGAARPLCVDLDGTLVATDTVWEAILHLLRYRPWVVWRLPVLAAQGLPNLKAWLADEVVVDVATLPYRSAVVEFLKQQKSDGRRLILATGADERFARDVAAHVGLFDEVVGTRTGRNCTGSGKCQAIASTLGDGVAFDYIGDSRADVAVWQSADRAYMVNPTSSVHRRVHAGGRLEQVFRDPGGGNRLMALLVSMRPQQWVKNLLLAAPMLLGQQLFDPVRWWLLLVAIACFSLAASVVYLINDLFDLKADRLHPSKRHRPLAAGVLPIPWALAAVPVLLVMALGLAAAVLPAAFVGLVAGYVALALMYSWAVKGKAILDVIWLAGLYTLRLIAGGVAVAVLPSAWLLGLSMFCFLSLAFAKRYAELGRIAREQGTAAAGRDYQVSDMSLIGTAGLVAGYMAVLVFALYINSDVVTELYTQPVALWLICPLLVYWFTRLWLKAHRQEMRDDPLMFTLTDPATYGVGLLVVIVAVVAAWPG
ncbi:UbiA family prenyltransferase [Phycisphaerales bacterium AB-hyl4]|uniref:UbiA family prenyltransferase n=1 Tax=Natronomicrosphaera hydrolytica TaxID=3242702 RepID=A0ABV4UB88_9BACT